MPPRPKGSYRFAPPSGGCAPGVAAADGAAAGPVVVGPCDAGEGEAPVPAEAAAGEGDGALPPPGTFPRTMWTIASVAIPARTRGQPKHQQGID